MRTTVTIDAELYERAKELTGIEGKSALLREGLRVLVERGSARALARLGGTEPGLMDIPRRRSEAA